MTLDALRISFIYGRTAIGPLASDGAGPRPYPVDRDAYAERFETPPEQADGGKPARPWPPFERQAVWESYLGVEHGLANVSARKAYANLVPLRFVVLPEPTTGAPDTRILAEAFVYPWGIALVLTLTMTAGWAASGALADAAVALRHGAFAADDVGPVTLDVLADTLLERLCGDVFGDAASRRWNAEPFTISTLLHARGPADAFFPDQPGVHQLLHALSTFSRTYGTEQLGTVAEHRVAGRKAPPAGHEVYGTRRGRAVWGPQHFTRPRGHVRTLGCQHRNLVLASTQVESLAALVLAARRCLGEGEELGLLLRAQTKFAVGALARFYDGKSSYRTGSVRQQIVANEWLEPINAVRDELGMSAIA